MHDGTGLHRFQDPVDGKVYLHSQFASYDAHRAFACFDQPDLKGTYSFEVKAPEDWVVVSNTAGKRVGSVWTFPKTEVMSTYLAAIVAGHYHCVDQEHRGIPRGIYCRQSLMKYLDPDELFQLTREGLDYFEERFGYPYMFGKYDQLFVPEFSAGAMENAGCVTFAESYVFRSRVTEGARMRRCETLLHEMSHMWFGDLVTMRWWDDLWLNETFATYMGNLGNVEATRFKDTWTTFAMGYKAGAKRQVSCRPRIPSWPTFLMSNLCCSTSTRSHITRVKLSSSSSSRGLARIRSSTACRLISRSTSTATQSWPTSSPRWRRPRAAT